MRVRELEAWLLDHGWAPEPDKGGVTAAWQHPTGGRLTYHRPHGTTAKEMPKSMVRDVFKRLSLSSDGDKQQEDAS